MNKNAQIILDTINASTDHPTAEQVYLHLKERGTKVSMDGNARSHCADRQ